MSEPVGSDLERALAPGVVVVGEEGATELICVDQAQMRRAIAYFNERGVRPSLRWRCRDGSLARHAGDGDRYPDYDEVLDR